MFMLMLMLMLVLTQTHAYRKTTSLPDQGNAVDCSSPSPPHSAPGVCWQGPRGFSPEGPAAGAVELGDDGASRQGKRVSTRACAEEQPIEAGGALQRCQGSARGQHADQVWNCCSEGLSLQYDFIYRQHRVKRVSLQDRSSTLRCYSTVLYTIKRNR